MKILELFFGIYQNEINPFLYVYNDQEFLLKCRWILEKENFHDNLIKYKKWDLFELQLDQYFYNKLNIFNIKLFNYYKNSSFTFNVLEKLKNIPFGVTKTYFDLASNLKNPKAVRAVGSICRKNPFPVIIPCHRIVGKNNFGGYMGRKEESIELAIKRKLLNLEGIDFYL